MAAVRAMALACESALCVLLRASVGAHPRRAADDVADGSRLLRAGRYLACGCDRGNDRAHCRGRARGEAHGAGTPSSSRHVAHPRACGWGCGGRALGLCCFLCDGCRDAQPCG
eukprot:58104-Pleurochrysis_carterae.AAC.1